MVEGWVRRLADEFWEAAGPPGPFPRDLEGPMLWALPLAVVKLPRLGLWAVREWLEGRRLVVHPALRQGDRPLRGCLVAAGGEGFVFVDGADPADERRVTLAHEVAHYLADYHAPRARLVRRLGPGVLAALDGRRPPTSEERGLAAVLGVPLRPHVHLLDRGPGGDVARALVHGAELRAHRLALELLAPAEAVRARLIASGGPRLGRRLVPALTDLLVDEFGLPPGIAHRYARQLAGADGQPTVREWLGLE
ncbi:MAG TPA: hypothetical protein VIN09_02185 [Chloroflexota bacterium]